MAVDKIPSGTALRMQFQTGVDGDGDPIYRTKSLSNVKTEAQDQDIFDVAQALVQLQEYPLVAVQRVDSAILEEV
ncbi:DUF1659 domain-containing protein [Desulfallas thermosapovorans]|uniref:Uncharacterized protein DUF1659 n=1 Tax=Desulfallas thermosapovorans DSM 6562 TaxID=1121431 RepID=A0A5S4ZN97_9FIRM|nr:DUF1659 domain-containing protein [Desulfallas thermosapovorans]TYO92295.1 uncharacterized protein DUF1659 [Desulfallas thermosapovorans DSM 6562]